MLRIWKATINSRNGMAFAFRSEQAIREEVFALVLSLPVAWLVAATATRAVELVCSVGGILERAHPAVRRSQRLLVVSSAPARVVEAIPRS